MLTNQQHVALRRLCRLRLHRITGDGYINNYFDMHDWQDRISEEDFRILNEHGLLRQKSTQIIPPFTHEIFCLTPAARALLGR